MSIYRVAMSFPFDSALPRDEMSINPHFFGTDPEALAAALKANLQAHATMGSRPFHLKVYDAEHAPPSYPLATAEQAGTVSATGVPRELSLCLSYYSTWNRVSLRGRLYLPYGFFAGAAGTRPTTPQMQAVVNSHTVFSANLPESHNWVVYSRKLGQANGVTDVWCDDEWDIQRSRGLRPTTRIVATV